MDVPRRDFVSKRQELEASISECCFAAIDSEFTGLVPPGTFHPLDTVAERYGKLRKEISNYLIVQLGLSLFTYNTQTGSYDVRTYNFYVFPDGSDHETFLSDSQCIKFLVQHGFDLNRCVREGLPFMRPAVFEERKSALETRQRLELKKILPEKHVSDIDNVLNETLSVEEILKAPQPVNDTRDMEKSAEDYINMHWKSITTWMKSNRAELVLPSCSELVRLPFYEHMERVFFNARFEMEALRPEQKEQQPGMKKIRLFRSETSPTERLCTRQRKERTDLDERFGVSYLMKFLAQSRKPIVLHNCVHDLLLIISQFFAPLPEQYVEFQVLCNELFPNLFDTKFMVQFGTLKQYFRGTRLSDVYNQTKSQEKTFPMPRVNTPDGYGYADETREHEAGFDAYMTGYIFAAISQFLLPNKKNSFRKLDANDTNIVPFKNKVPFASSLDIACFNIDPSALEESLNRNNVFVVEWDGHENASYARAVVAQVGGFKKIGFGESVLTFLPNNVKACFDMLKTAHELPSYCRFYKHSTPFQKVSTSANKSKTHRRRNRSGSAEVASPPLPEARIIPESSSSLWSLPLNSDGWTMVEKKKRRVEESHSPKDCRQEAALSEGDW